MSTIELEKQTLVKSIWTRKICKMHTGHLNQYAPSKEYIEIAYSKIYGPALIIGIKWTVEQAAHFLVGEDPADDYWLPNTGHYVTAEYQKMSKAITDSYMREELQLIEQRQTNGRILLVAENIEFIRWAINTGLNNIPDVLLEYASSMPYEKSISVKLIPEKHDSLACSYSIIKDGEGYIIIFNNIKLPFIVASKGLEYLKMLLLNPNKEFSINDLYKIANPNMPVQCDVNLVDSGLDGFTVSDDTANSSDLIDDETLERLNDLEEKIRQAILAENIKLAEKLENQREILQKYIIDSSFKGESKKFPTDTDSRRSTVQQSITAAIKKIGDLSPELNQHLTTSIKKQRGKCWYQPAEAIDWYIPL
jgi:hypothetical protein